MPGTGTGIFEGGSPKQASRSLSLKMAEAAAGERRACQRGFQGKAVRYGTGARTMRASGKRRADSAREPAVPGRQLIEHSDDDMVCQAGREVRVVRIRLLRLEIEHKTASAADGTIRTVEH